MEESWRDINGYEGLYTISNQGQVKSLHNRKERMLKAVRGLNGYLFVNLCKDGVQKHFYIHRLVAEAFLPKVEGKEFIDHINTDKTDNRVENIRYCSRVENQNNPLTKEKMSEVQKGEKNHMYGKFGAEHPNSKPIVGTNKTTGEEVRFACTMEAQRVLGIKQPSITACLKGRQKSAGGYYWRYA